MHLQQREGRVTLFSDPAIEKRGRERGTMLIELLAIPSKSEKAATAGGGTEARRK
jgi:hypothetical protein